MTCVDSAELDVLMSGERYWFILSCATTDPSNLDVNTVVYSNDACEGLPSFDAEFDVLSQCSCDELGLYNSSDNFNLSPPSPPSPPHPPEAPPLIIVNGSEVFINQSYSNHLQDAIATEQVTTVIITVDVLLDSRLPAVNRTLAVLGRCGSPPESGSERCVIDGSLPGSIFHVQVGGALRLECLALTNQRAMSQTLGGAVSGGSRVSGNRATSGGGLFAGPSARVTVEEGSSVEHNSAMGTGGGVYTASHTQLLVQNSAVTNNMAGNFGGAIAVMGENASAILHSVIMRSNIAQGEGGGLYATDPSYATTDKGGAVYVEAGTLLFEGCVLEDNQADGGGAVGGELASVVVRNSTLAGNVANEGAGIHVSHGNVTLAQRALVIQNSAQRVGGGLFCLDCAVVIEGGSDVAQNVVAYSQYTYGSGNGGGVYLTAASRDKGQSVCLTLDGAAITGNGMAAVQFMLNIARLAFRMEPRLQPIERDLVGESMGTMPAASPSTMAATWTETQQAAPDGGSGGGGLLAGPVNQNAAGNRHPAGTLVVVERSSVGHNSVEGAADGGGCILTGSNCTVVLDQAMLVNCSSQGDGGGVHLGPESTLVASNRTQILSCITEGHGGGMYGSDGSELLLHQETLVHANRGDQAGGIYVLGSL
eukprot:gene25549-31227_t